MAEENHSIIEEVNKAESWFPAVKTAPVWAKISTGTEVIPSREGDVTAEKGDMICRGPDGDTWTQDADKFHAKYRSANEEPGNDGFSKYVPIPENSRIMAARIDHPFEVKASHGLLKGQAGDYLVKAGADEGKAFPPVWIVNADIFHSTYQRVEE